jgi:hypothetical protein
LIQQDQKNIFQTPVLYIALQKTAYTPFNTNLLTITFVSVSVGGGTTLAVLTGSSDLISGCLVDGHRP